MSKSSPSDFVHEFLAATQKEVQEKLVEAAKKGAPAKYTTGDKELDDPAKGADWGPERKIPAKAIYALAVGDNPQVHAKGVRILGAKIVGPLDLEGAKVPHPLALINCFIEELVTLRDADALSISLDGSRVAGIKADRLHTRGSVLLRDGFHAKGEVNLSGAKIRGTLECSGGTFDASGVALNLEGVVAAGLLLRWLKAPPVGIVDLAYANVGTLTDDQKSWPKNGKLYLDGFVYGRLAGDAPWRAHDWKDDRGVPRKGRLHWLSLQPKFRPQPYEQLIKVLKEMGHEQDAREVAIAKQQQLREHGGLSRLSRAKNLFLDKTIKYGYESWRAFILLFVVWFFGTGMFCMAEWTGVMVPSEKEAYDPTGRRLEDSAAIVPRIPRAAVRNRYAAARHRPASKIEMVPARERFRRFLHVAEVLGV